MTALRFVGRRLLLAVPTLFLLATITFWLGYLSPSDPVQIKLGQHASAEAAAQVRRQYGLDQPALVQYARFLQRLLMLDLGTSFAEDRPVLSVLNQGAPVTAMLAAVALVFAVGCGVPLGVFAAANEGRWLDRAAVAFSLLGASLPAFVLGPLLIYVFALQLGWLPVARWGTPEAYLLPAVTLAARPAALLARITRAGMLEVMRQDYIRTAHAKGLARATVVLRHALRNALLPTLTVGGSAFGYLLGGSFVVERLFNVPGIGYLSLDAVSQRDYPVIQATTLLLGAGFVMVNLLVDLLYAVVDPRIRIADASPARDSVSATAPIPSSG
jgi:ABC-type dipeptide/oligopeptide/nickel transport system permease component